MIGHLLAIHSMLATPVSETVWWRTPGGLVTEYEEGDRKGCDLTLYNKAGDLSFHWEQTKPTYAVATINDWVLPSDYSMNVAIKINGVWLHAGEGTPNIVALANGPTVTFPVDPDIDILLTRRADITIRIADHPDFSVSVAPRQASALTEGLRKCRTLINQ